MTSWVRGGVLERARFTSCPSPGGEVPLFDMMDGRMVNDHVPRATAGSYQPGFPRNSEYHDEATSPWQEHSMNRE